MPPSTHRPTCGRRRVYQASTPRISAMPGTRYRLGARKKASRGISSTPTAITKPSAVCASSDHDTTRPPRSATSSRTNSPAQPRLAAGIGHRRLVVPPGVVRPQVLARQPGERQHAQPDQHHVDRVIDMNGVAPREGVDHAEQQHQHHEPDVDAQSQMPGLGGPAETVGVPQHPVDADRMGVLHAQVGGRRLVGLQGEGEGRMQVGDRPFAHRQRIARTLGPPAACRVGAEQLHAVGAGKGHREHGACGRRHGGQLQAVPDRHAAAQRHHPVRVGGPALVAVESRARRFQ